MAPSYLGELTAAEHACGCSSSWRWRDDPIDTDAIVASVLPNANFESCSAFASSTFDFRADVSWANPNVGLCIQVKGQGSGASHLQYGRASLRSPHAGARGRLRHVDQLDVVDEEGSYVVVDRRPHHLSIEALHNATALLPRIVVENPKQVIGNQHRGLHAFRPSSGYIGLIECIGWARFTRRESSVR